MAGLTKELALRMPLNLGASKSGIATKTTLSGQYLTDLEYVLPGARSAIIFCVPFNESLIEPFLSKKSFELSDHKIRTTTLAFGISFEISTVLTSLGYKACPVSSNFAFRKDTPNGIFDRIPPISLKLMARACGIGHIAQSGLLINREHGAAFSLGGIVTDADLEPTEPLPESENYCDRCLICKKACVADHINPGATTIEMGNETIRAGNCRLPARCAYPCGGLTGLHKSGEWSTWSPGRFPLPEEDEEYRTISKKYVQQYLQRKRDGAISYNPLLAYPFEMQYACSNCQFVCHPDVAVRKRRLELLRKSGVVIEDENGNKHAVTPQEAEGFLSKMTPERRRLFTDE
jgi:epoxyqueuosine reductase QueG